MDRDAGTAVKLLEAEPSLAGFPLLEPARELAAAARRHLASAKQAADARARLTWLGDRHADAVFAGADFPGLDAPGGLARTRQAVAAGLGVFGVTATNDGPPAIDPVLYTPDEARLVLNLCYELLVLDAVALLRPQPDEPPAAARGRVAEALARIDRADRLRGGAATRCGLRVRADAHDAAGDQKAAETARAAADATPPALPADHFFAALDHVRRDDFTTAVDALGETLRAQPDHPGAEYLLAVCRLRGGQPQAAREGLARLLDHHKGLAWPRLLRGFASIEMKDWEAARGDFDAVLAAAPRPDPVTEYIARVNRGVMHMKRREWPAAVADLRAATAARPAFPAAYLNLALTYRQQAELPGWREEAMALAPGGVVDLAVAEANQRAARRAAVAVLDDAVAKCPPEARLFHERGRLRVQLADPGPAKEDFAKAAALAAGRGRAGTLADDLIELGRLREADGEHARAVEAYRAAAAANPARAVTWRLLARPLMALGRYREAEAALDKYLAAAPVAPGREGGPDLTETLAGALRARGLAAEEEAKAFRASGALRARSENLRAALESYTRGLALARQPDTLVLRGWTFLALDAPGLAEADFDEAVKLRPAAADALLGRANARALLGSMAAAVADAEAGLAAGAADPTSLYRAARVHAMAAPWYIRTGSDARAAGRAVSRAAELLGRAVQASPADSRKRFWREYVRADRAFDGIRAGDAMAALAAKYDARD